MKGTVEIESFWTGWKREQRGLLGWVILVPIVGLVMTVIGKLWDILEATIPFVAKIFAFVAKISGSFYQIYLRHPYVVLAVVVLGAAYNFAWSKWWPMRPRYIRNRYLHFACIVVGIVLAVHVVCPLGDLLSPSAPPSSQVGNNDQKKAH